MPEMLPPRGPGGSKSGPGGFQSASGHHVSPKGPPRAPQIALGGGPGGPRRGSPEGSQLGPVWGTCGPMHQGLPQMGQCIGVCPRWVNASGLAPDGYPIVRCSRDCVAVGSRNRPRHFASPCSGCHAEHGVPTALEGRSYAPLERPVHKHSPRRRSPSCPCLGRVAPTLLLR